MNFDGDTCRNYETISGTSALSVTGDLIINGKQIDTDRLPTKENKKKEGNRDMNLSLNNLLKDVYFGRANGNYALSINGKVTYKGKYYDDGALNDSMGLTIDANGLIFIIPSQTISKGDIVLKGNVPCYYDGVNFISYEDGSKVEYVPTKIFNMTFYSVVKNFAANMFGGGNMNNMLPFLLLQDRKDNDNDNLLLMMMMSNGGLDFSSMFGTKTPEAPNK